MTMNCSFCAEATKVQEIVRNGEVRVLYPLAPFVRPYVFIIPTRHVERFADLSVDEVVAMHGAARAILCAFGDMYGATGLNVFTNDGPAAGQSVPHVHFHLFGRYEEEPVSPFRILNDPDRWPSRLADEEIRRRADEIADALAPYWSGEGVQGS